MSILRCINPPMHQSSPKRWSSPDHWPSPLHRSSPLSRCSLLPTNFSWVSLTSWCWRPIPIAMIICPAFGQAIPSVLTTHQLLVVWRVIPAVSILWTAAHWWSDAPLTTILTRIPFLHFGAPSRTENPFDARCHCDEVKDFLDEALEDTSNCDSKGEQDRQGDAQQINSPST